MTKIAKKVSIITINWNNAAGLQKTIESVVPQLTDEIEYIVVEGQSTDGSPEIVEKYLDNIDCYISDSKSGIYADMNKGLAKATGEYCLFLNSGDWLVDNILPSVIASCSGEDIIYFNTYLSYDALRIEKLYYSDHLTMNAFFKRTIGHQSTLIARRLFDQYGMYTETYTVHSDYEFWIKSIVLGNALCKYQDIFISYYDMSGTSSAGEKYIPELEDIQLKYLPKRILDDYAYWYEKDRDMETLMWYRNQKLIYPGLVFIYKVVKNIDRTISRFLK